MRGLTSLMRARVRYRGRVQGVGFRATASAMAAGFAVTGWVKNEPDGSVLLEAQGETPEVNAFLAKLGQAMDRYIHESQRVEGADVSDERDFHIRY